MIQYDDIVRVIPRSRGFASPGTCKIIMMTNSSPADQPLSSARCQHGSVSSFDLWPDDMTFIAKIDAKGPISDPPNLHDEASEFLDTQDPPIKPKS